MLQREKEQSQSLRALSCNEVGGAEGAPGSPRVGEKMKGWLDRSHLGT